MWGTRKKSSLFPYERTALSSGTPNFFGPSYFEAALSKQKDGWIYKINLLSKLRQSSFTSFLQVKEKSGPPLESACSMASNNGVGSNPTQQSYSSQSATSFLSSSDHQAFNSQTTASFANSSIVTSSATATGSIFRSKIGHCNGTLLSPLGM